MAPQQHVFGTVFLYWLIMASLIVFGLFIAWDNGIIWRLLSGDTTRISTVICVIFVGSTVYCGMRCWFLANQENYLKHIPDEFSPDARRYPRGLSVAEDYLHGLFNKEKTRGNPAELMAESYRGSLQVGWFMASLVIKLGLLGTVAGFVIMLGSISDLGDLDTNDIKELMAQMTLGMGIAMNTTMVGLVASTLLGLQYLLLERQTDRVVFDTIKLGETLSLEAA